MKIVIQRVSEASVKIEGQVKNREIGTGIVVLLGITHEDDTSDIDWLIHKTINMRIFNDENGVMNKSLLDIRGDVLLISQFTLHASTKKGNRPSYMLASHRDKAIPLYKQFIAKMEEKLGRAIQVGEFGSNMKVWLVNDGPVTIIMDSKDKK